jgi:hypothetical protein
MFPSCSYRAPTSRKSGAIVDVTSTAAKIASRHAALTRKHEQLSGLDTAYRCALDWIVLFAFVLAFVVMCCDVLVAVYSGLIRCVLYACAAQ